ncbi:MAG: tRNA (N6-isopentenyl adenosine(37)-C2)-methylthiotransferase MiaB [Clostridiales Family XIII bacterium]|jgi:tRNA-2-methylthio-N6-dimethylallyladenosine synthase|nr:tRNA (N6-isopentenyl adenosine(37)-C2)-methylthiotransferase MiaB [Clostridiales Family XIII bacterium]
MKEININSKYYLIETMGCQMNERDSETVAGMLENLGYGRVPPCAGGVAEARALADVIVVNTCSVRENADNRFFGVLGQIKKAKEQEPSKIVAVCGCMMQQEHVVERIRRVFPWVDIVFGTMNIEAFPSLLADAQAKSDARGKMIGDARGKTMSTVRGETVVDVRDSAGPADSIVEGLPSKREHPHKAFVNIMYGCNNYCTYCIVPYTRGRERSREPEAILDEVRSLAQDGVKEVMLLGQNVNSYCGGGTDFPALIGLLDEIPGIERLRFMTSHPKDLSDELVECYRTARRLCPSIHLPIQSGSTEVLRRMNRGYAKEDYLALIDKLRGANPDIVITTDFIVGFPGETDADFAHTMDVIERVRFDSAFTFLYSPRTGTPAAEYEDQVPDDIAHERFERMVNRLNDITMEKNRRLVGGVYDVLIEGESKTDKATLSGRTPGGKLVNIRPPEPGDYVGQILPVRLTEANTFSFLGEFA